MGRARETGLMLAAGFALVLAAGGAHARQELTVTNFGEMEPVVFDHTSHAEAHGCEACHHAQRSGGAHRCGACHLANAAGAALKFEDAAHKEGVGRCWSCHLKERAGKKLECEECHWGTAK